MHARPRFLIGLLLATAAGLAPVVCIAADADELRFGGGLDYMVAENVALGFELGYLISRGNTLSVGGHSQTVDLDALLMTGGLRIFFGKPTPR
jgi:hypothetical protein